ncbi:mannitol dehydrogenase family protein [Aliiroseovarius sp. 2305UL8-7]|uniref:mannitol dehydrogenase family protein n=1 Tax=Aliiroseovarius conchicola TaxID=3121637 RepID=UPI0035289502
MAPANEETRPGVGIVHLGLGAFFRAHGAVYIADAMEASGGDWGVLGVSLKSSNTRDKLKPQGWVYTALELADSTCKTRVIQVLQDVLVAPENPTAVLAALAAPSTKIVSLTVTEKGYCLNSATGRINFSHPDIKTDLKSRTPVSAPGYLMRALQIRKEAGLPAFSVLSLDNLPENGHLAKSAVCDLARATDTELADWIEKEVTFPSTMVDRIVPATTEDVLDKVREMTGIDDQAAVQHEPFRQWVIEDNFVDDDHPDFAAAGATLVDDVRLFEHMKLRMLNGAHSALAYLGYLAGHKSISDTLHDPVFDAFISDFWDAEVIPALQTPPGTNLHSYAVDLKQRFANTAIRHQTWQIAMDGSQKLPQRILNTLFENMDSNRPHRRLLLALAGWMQYVSGLDDSGAAIDVRDPLSEKISDLLDGVETAEDRVAALCTLEEVFAGYPVGKVRPQLTALVNKLERFGSRATIKDVLKC